MRKYDVVQDLFCNITSHVMPHLLTGKGDATLYLRLWGGGYEKGAHY